MKLYQIYRPLIATPFRCTETYTEFQVCDALKPYICCFWGTRRPILKKIVEHQTTGIVIPDTCMDIMFTVDITNNKIRSSFCGIDDKILITRDYNEQEKLIFQFAIRFYAWGVHAFSEETLKGVKGNFFDVGYHFAQIKRELDPLVSEVTEMKRLIPLMEQVLLQHLKEKRRSADILQAVHQLLRKKGNITVRELSQELYIGERQLERLFQEYIGCSPKNLASMIRYQYLWNDVLFDKHFNVLNAVDKYGYSDQAHLCHEFKKFHALNIGEARKYAMQNVGNIQDFPTSL